MKSSSAESSFAWNDQLRVGHAHMDDDHQVFARLIQELIAAPDPALPGCLEQVIAHAKAHFGQEDAWMLAFDFPARQCHMNEHVAVLRSAAGVQRRLQAGDNEATRRFAQELAMWFPPHVQHLDSALAAWICKQAWNAKPLVFHRPPSRVPVATAAVAA